MKLNRKLPYGVVSGHEWAMFEQNGILFDGSGEARKASTAIEKASRSSKASPKGEAADTSLKVANAAEFLRNILGGGPVDKSIVYREAENNNQHWEDVKTAFSKMNGQQYMQGETKLWRLLPEFSKNA